MPTSKEQCSKIQTQLDRIGDFTCRPMMGEYLLYFRGIHIGGIYDSRILLKDNPSLVTFNLPERIPYTNARPMLLLTSLDDPATSDIFESTYQYYLTHPTKKRRNRDQ